MSYLKNLASNWDDLGQTDPLWAIASDPSKKGRKWAVTDFLETGIEEVAALMAYLDDRHVHIHRERALDFGCGVGRLTQAFAGYFTLVDGVDIAPSMIDRANELNQFGSRCKYHLNSAEDLSFFDDEKFDLVYSSFVLQHIHPTYQKKYIKEFLRVLVPKGLLVFLLPSKSSSLTAKLYTAAYYPLVRTYLKTKSRLQKCAIMEFYWVDKSEVVGFLDKNGGTVIDVADVADKKYWHNTRYCAVKA